MRDLSKLPSITPEILANAPPRGASGAFRFSLDGVPEHEKPMLTREFFGRSVIKYDIERTRDAGKFEIDVTLQMMPGLMMMSGKAHGSCNRRTREMVALENSDDVGMIVNVRGQHRIAMGGEELVLGDGEAVFMSLAEVCSYTHRAPGDILALRVPRARLGPLLGAGIDDCLFHRIPAGTPGLKLLSNYIAMSRDDHTIAGRDLQHLVVNHVCDLMAVVIGATRDAAAAAELGGLRGARLQAIKDDIARNLERRELTVAEIADRHRCTPRFVQRLFESEGTTFTGYVLSQRLACAHRFLIDPRRGADKISAVAYDAGFGDVSYFNRAFRRHYGAAPSDVRARARQSAAGRLA
ncbi:MAG TPA: AraC family transcriptional regulator [Pseudolabrys sp.]|nr:AraC family transcriptional regulator [Pseudolabrys sp.]